jgi:acetyl-CoA acyltransferase 2
MAEIVFVAAKRTPFGSFGGSFKDTNATDLAVHAAKAALEQSSVSPDEIDHVIFGNVIQTSSDAAYLARHVALRSGCPSTTPAVTTNRLCGSGFEAIAEGARRIRLEEAQVILAGGSENMTQAPFVLRNARFGYRLSHGELEDSLVAALFDSYAKVPMAITAENLAERYSISREESDLYALESQKRAARARDSGHFQKEISHVTLSSRGKETVVSSDEHIRPDVTAEGLKKLKPVFKKDGVVTAGNASGMVDGAVALVMTTRDVAKKRGWKVLGSFVDSFVIGCDPSIMGIGPVPAVQGILTRNKLSLKDISLFEINEAFAPQLLAVQKELGIPADRLNIDGGAIAIGHPLAASGARLVSHLLYRLQEKGAYGLASACIGGGQGMAVLVRRE